MLERRPEQQRKKKRKRRGNWKSHHMIVEVVKGLKTKKTRMALGMPEQKS
jgi:hypothetical protein